MSKIEIREATSDDADILIAYTKRVGGESDNLTFGADGLPVTTEQEKAFLQSMHDDKHSVFYCAWKIEELIATGSITGLPRRMNHRAELALSVVKAEWNNGVGSMLMEKLIEYAKQHGIEIINLDVRSDNVNAIHLYKKYGFKHIGTSPAFFKINGKYIDFELMYLDLRQMAQNSVRHY